MPKCPNCGQKTKRTQDWTCQWCGYPIFSRSFKKIDKTFRQLQAERRGATEPELEPPTVEEVPTAEPEPVAEVAPEPSPPAVEAVPVAEPEPESLTVEEVPTAEPELVAELKPEPAPSAIQAAPVAELAPAAEVAPEPAPPVANRVPETTILAAEPAPAPEAAPEQVEPAVAPPAERTVVPLEMTVAELASAYIQDVTAANARFINQVLRITGEIDQIEVNNITDNYYIVLSSTETSGMREVKCTFDKEHAAPLNQLPRGQSVTVQGRYVGYMIHILLRDCVLV